MKRIRNYALSLFEVDENGSQGGVVALGPGAIQARERCSASPASTGGSKKEAAGEDAMLGTLVWFSVSDAVRLTPEVLRKTMEEAGLKGGVILAPHGPGEASALSRAAQAAEVHARRLSTDHYGAPLGKETYANVLIHTVSRGTKQVVTEVLDSQKRRLSYQPFATVTPTEDGSKLCVEVLAGGRPLAVENTVVENLCSYYDFEKERHDSEAVRRVIGRVLYTAKAVPLRNSGGMYFVPRSSDSEAESLIRFVDEVRDRSEDAPAKKAKASRAMSVPLVDREEYREVVSDSLDEHVEKEAKALVKEMSALLKGEQAITPKRGREFIQRVGKLKEDVASYEELLEMSATQARAALELASKEANSLLEKVGG